MGIDIAAWLKNAAWVTDIKNTITSLGLSIKSLQDNASKQSVDFLLLVQKVDLLNDVVADQKARISKLEDNLDRLRDRNEQRTDMLFMNQLEKKNSPSERVIIIDQPAPMLKGSPPADGG
jgi:hypothetical protein